MLGAGSWGTALAVHLGRVGHDVRLWARDRAVAAEISARRANAIYLPDVSLPETVLVTASLAEALSGTDLVVSAIPSHGCRAVMRAGGRSSSAARHDRQRDEGPRERHAAADVGGDRRGAGPGPPGRRAVRTELRDGGRPRAADGRARRLDRACRDRARAGGVPRSVLPSLRIARCRRRRDWRRAEERHRDCRRRRRRARASDTTRWRR